MKALLKYLAIAATALGLLQTVNAAPQLRMFDGVTTITITDNGLGDSQAAPGQVVWVGAIGGWTLNVHTGTTFPVIGSLTNPMLDLNFNATSNLNAPGTLYISFSADGFGPTNGAANALIGGTIAAGGSLTYTTYGGTNNSLFSTTNQLTSQGPFTAGAFSGTTSGGSVNNAGPYALTQTVAITHGAGTSITTGDALLQVPDSGTSILLLGSGLLGLGLFSRLRRRLS